MEDIENLIEELTKVRPEMLNEEALKLFNTIMAILDERDKLKEENKELKFCHEHQCKDVYDLQNKILELETEYDKLTKHFIDNHIPKSKIKEIRDKAEVMDYYTLSNVIEDLNKLLGDEN